MKKLTIRNTAIILVLIIISGCKTFFEEEISDQTVKLISPSEGIETEVVSQTFLWGIVEGASQYRLQIVSPSFDSSEVLTLDTLVTRDKFSFILYPSVFEWRVRAENSAWKTNWTTSHFQIYSTSNLTRQRINLLSPGLITNTTNIGFQWDELYNADNYIFVVYQTQWDGILVSPPILVISAFLELTLSDGKYVWGVKAKNTTSETLFSQKSLIVDTTPPEIAILTSPIDSSVVTNSTVSFTWTSSDQTSGIAQDTLKVFSDQSLKNLVKSVVSDNESAEISFSERREYYWTVRSVDKAGNVSTTSDTFTFTIK